MTAEQNSVLDLASTWLAGGERVAVATVIATWSSSPRPVGSQMVIAQGGRFAGSVSGGCVEDDLIYRIRNRSLAVEKPEVATSGIS